MTVPSSTSRDQQAGNGVSTIFTVPFRILDQTHLRVLSTTGGVTVPLALTTDYTVSGVRGVNTTVTFLVAPAVGTTITFLREVPLTQEIDYTANDSFPAETHEDGLDKLTMIVQQLAEIAGSNGRTIRIPPQVSGVSTEMPVPVGATFWGWNLAGTAPQLYTLADIATTAAFASWAYDTFVGDGATASFTLGGSPGTIANMDVSIDGVTQVPADDYTLLGDEIAFNVSPANGAVILVRYGQSLPALSGAAFIEQIEVAVAAGDFTVALGAANGDDVQAVYYNGVLQHPSAYSIAGTTITFNEVLPAAGSVVAVVSNIPAAGIGAGNIAYTAPGGVTRRVRERLADVVSVKDYGALGDGVADDTVAIQSAIDYVASIGGGTVWFPSGTYKLSATLTVDVNGVHLLGDGMLNTELTRSGDYGDTVFFTGDDAAGTPLNDVGIAGFTIRSTGLTTSGAHVHFNGVTRAKVHGMNLQNGFIGFKCNRLTAAYLSCIYLVFTDLFGGSAAGRRFMAFGSAAATYAHPSCGDVFVSDFNVRGNTANENTEYGILIESGDGLWFNNGHVGNTSVANIALHAVDAANSIGLVFFNGVMSDEGASYGLQFSGNSSIGRNIQFSHCCFKGGPNGVIGIYTTTTASFNGVQFTNCFVTEFNERGVYLQSAQIKNFDFVNLQVRGNSDAGAGSFPGVTLVDVKDVRFFGGKFGGQNVDGTTAGNQSYGLTIGTGVGGILVAGVDLTDNTTGSLSVNALSAGEVRITNCLSQDSTAITAAATITVPATGEFFTVNGNTGITAITASHHSRRVTLVFTGTPTVTDGGNLKLNGNFVATADDTLTLVCDGTNWYEVARSAN